MDHSNRDIYDPHVAICEARPLIEQAGPIFRLVLNYSTHILAEVAEAEHPKLSDTAPAIFLARQSLELLDAAMVLMTHSIVTPVQPILRSHFETVLNLDYMLKNHPQERALAWLCADYKSALANESLYDNSLGIVDAIRHELTLPEFEALSEEYDNRLEKRGYPPLWYSLQGGPKSLRALSRVLQCESMYELLYGHLSDFAHARTAGQHVEQVGLGESYLLPLRSPSMFGLYAHTSITLAVGVNRIGCDFFQTGHDVRAWFLDEIQPDLNKLLETKRQQVTPCI